MHLKDSFEVVEESSMHHYRTEIPNIVFGMGIDPIRFAMWVNYFFNGTDIPAKEWRYFVSKGMAETYTLSDEYILSVIKSKNPQKLQGAKKICEWCSSETLILHSHHYPIKRCDGGEETVKICANCHCEYHYLEERKYRFKSQYACEVVE